MSGVLGLPFAARSDAPGAAAPVRPLYWSVRRELWEHRAVWFAPLAVAAFVLLGFVISLFTLPQRVRALPALSEMERHEIATLPYSAVAAALILTAFFVGVYYFLEALQGEHRDRGVLFWKSLPVSDSTTVLAKASVPFLVLPALVFAIGLAAQLVMLALSLTVLLGSGVDVSHYWHEAQFFPSLLAMLYATAAVTLWHGPIYGFLLLVSGWARRAAFLWALLPPLALIGLERIAFGTTRVQAALQYLLTGWLDRAFQVPAGGAATDHLGLVAAERLLSTPSFWVGLGFAAACLAAAVRLRRQRGPA